MIFHGRFRFNQTPRVKKEIKGKVDLHPRSAHVPGYSSMKYYSVLVLEG